MVRPLYRSRQVMHALRPKLDEKGLGLARQHLSDAELSLFLSMEKRDQRHALEVAGRLRDQGVDSKTLLAAALLHDCGKGAVPVWLRIANVLSPTLVRRLAREQAKGWRSAAFRLSHHAKLSAEAASAAGAASAVIRLLHGKPAPEEAWMLPLLIAADDAS